MNKKQVIALSALVASAVLHFPRHIHDYQLSKFICVTHSAIAPVYDNFGPMSNQKEATNGANIYPFLTSLAPLKS